MRKIWGQAVDTSGKVLGKTANLYTVFMQHIVHGDKPRQLYQCLQASLRRSFHGFFAVPVSVNQQFLPTIHTTYKDNEKIKFKLT